MTCRPPPTPPRRAQEDYLNPTDFARTMNSLVPYELAGQGALVAILTLNWLFSFSSLKLVLLLLMGTHLAIQGMRYLSPPLRCCALPSPVLLPAAHGCPPPTT